MSGGKKLTTKQVAGVTALLTAPSKEAAAKLAGVSSKTLSRWEKLPEFVGALQEGRRALFRQAVDRVLSRIEKALDTIERNLTCGASSTEVRAATVLIDAAMRWNEQDVAEQLAEIRKTIEVLKRGA